MGATYSGLFGDYRVLMQSTRKHNMKYYLKYHENILLGNLARETA